VKISFKVTQLNTAPANKIPANTWLKFSHVLAMKSRQFTFIQELFFLFVKMKMRCMKNKKNNVLGAYNYYPVRLNPIKLEADQNQSIRAFNLLSQLY